MVMVRTSTPFPVAASGCSFDHMTCYFLSLSLSLCLCFFSNLCVIFLRLFFNKFFIVCLSDRERERERAGAGGYGGKESKLLMASEHAAIDVSINRFHCAQTLCLLASSSIVLIKDFPLIVPFSFFFLLLLSFLSFFRKKPQHMSVIRKLENCFAKWLLNCFCLFRHSMAGIIQGQASLNVRPGLLPTVVELIFPTFPLSFFGHGLWFAPNLRLAISGRTIQQLLLPIVIN